MSVVRTVGVVPHRDRKVALAMARHVASWFGERGVDVRLPDAEAAAAGLPELGCPRAAFGEGLDLAVSIGGDGTMLHTVELAYPAGALLLGVNVGQMGYLASIEPDELDAALPSLLSGDFEVAERTVLDVRIDGSLGTTRPLHALNEMVLEKVHPGHLVRLEVSVDGSFFTTYAADGVIVATATGSTAYSFSARGPIVSPNLACLVLTPVSPHMLFDRALVLAPDEDVRLVVAGSRPAGLTVDGRDVGELQPGDTLRCSAASQPARMVIVRPRDFHQILKAKFSLPDR